MGQYEVGPTFPDYVADREFHGFIRRQLAIRVGQEENRSIQDGGRFVRLLALLFGVFSGGK